MADTPYPVPLLNRLLVSDRQSRVTTTSTLTTDQLARDIAAHLGALFSTRGPGLARFEAPWPLTVIDFGYPDPGQLTTYDSVTLQRLQHALLRAVTSFETRLQQPQLTLHHDAARPGVLKVIVSGHITDARLPVQLVFNFGSGAVGASSS